MPEKTLKKLGNSIREHRKLKGYSQQELSENNLLVFYVL